MNKTRIVCKLLVFYGIMDWRAKFKSQQQMVMKDGSFFAEFRDFLMKIFLKVFLTTLKRTKLFLWMKNTRIRRKIKAGSSLK